MKRFLIVCACLLWVCSPAAPAAAADAAPGNVEFLTQARSNLPPMEVARNYLQAARADLGLTPADLEGLTVHDLVPSTNGMTHVYYRQKLGGLEVANAISNMNVAADGRVISLGNRFVPDLASKVNTMTPALDAREAILAGAEGLGLRLDSTLDSLRVDLDTPTRSSLWTGAGISTEPIPAKLALYRVSPEEVRLTWELVIQEPSGDHWWNLFVDAVTGDVVGQHDWVSWESYQVFALPKESPLDGGRTIESGVADATASPFGWHDTDGSAGAEFTDTRGNNVSAQEDRDANNSGGFRPDGGLSLDFQFPLDLATQQPVDYQAAAITNLFYWNNVIHDVLYQYGFDEASGNFQENNYGRGGSGSDSVNADAQDGSGTNNANFGTPPDGSNPRMQMFEWTPSADSIVRVTSPAAIAADYQASLAGFGSAIPGGGISGTFELVNDGSAIPSEGCNSLIGFTAGNVAVIDRGTCEFGTKVLNAENAGAIAAIVVNNQGDGLIAMGPGAQGGQVTISSVFIGQTDGGTIKGELPGVTGSLLDAGSSIPNRDSDLDNGVIVHEYGHGLSIRLTGGAGTSNCLSGQQQAGEGWSDWLALWFTAVASDAPETPRGIGNYVTFNPDSGPGIRRFPYSTDPAVNPDTYETIGSGISVPHGVGSVWAAILWDVYWELTNAHGFDPDKYGGTGGNNLALQLMIDGLKLQPCNPTFVDARDAILLADQNLTGGANRCLLWTGFAKRGLGVSADDGGSSNSLAVTNGFDIPTDCAQVCGNNVVEGTEVCDGTDLGGQTCGDFGCTGGGTLACNATCDGFDTSGCLDCADCDFDGICEVGEDCNGCPSDCVSGESSGAVCGNGVCEAGNGEDCTNCALDCNGVQNGNPNNRFCCGAGGGTNPVDCSDARCTGGGVSCTNDPVSGGAFCCGDGFCDAGEGCGNCGLDCATGAEVCDDGVDNDCNGDVDCDDIACLGDPVCDAPTGGGPGDPCTQDSECQSGKCKGNGTCR